MLYINKNSVTSVLYTVISLSIIWGTMEGSGWCQAKIEDLIRRSLDAPSRDITGTAYDGKYLWVADWKDDLIYKIDPNNGNQLDKMSSPGPAPTGLAWDGSHLWIADLHYDKAFRINVEKKMVVWEIPLPGSYPFGLAWDGKFLWLADRNEKKL